MALNGLTCAGVLLRSYSLTLAQPEVYHHLESFHSTASKSVFKKWSWSQGRF